MAFKDLDLGVEALGVGTKASGLTSMDPNPGIEDLILNMGKWR